MKAASSAINDPRFGSALLAHLQMRYPQLEQEKLAAKLGITMEVMTAIEAMRGPLLTEAQRSKWEAYLYPAQRAALRTMFQRQPKPSFWAAYFEE